MVNKSTLNLTEDKSSTILVTMASYDQDGNQVTGTNRYVQIKGNWYVGKDGAILKYAQTIDGAPRLLWLQRYQVKETLTIKSDFTIKTPPNP